eukprot:6568034-Karenia_brevis.AAC.1
MSPTPVQETPEQDSKEEPTGSPEAQPSTPSGPAAAAAVVHTGLSDLSEMAALQMKEPKLKPSDIPTRLQASPNVDNNTEPLHNHQQDVPTGLQAASSVDTNP